METVQRIVEKQTSDRKRSLIPGLIILLTSVAGICFMSWMLLRPGQEVLQAEIEAREIRVSGKLAGRILEIRVREGDTVQQGDTLVVLSSPELLAKLEQAEAAEDAALSQNVKMLHGTRREQIEAAAEVWKKARAGTEIAFKTYSRIQQLFEAEVVSAQKFDEAEAQYQAALATENAAKATYDLAVNGPQEEDRQLSRAMLNKAKGAVSEVEAYMHDIYLTAPSSGEVAEIFALEGELVGQGAPVLSLVDLSQVWLTLQVKEVRLADFRKGTHFTGTVPALNSANIQFTVNALKVLGNYATWKATKANGGFDVRTFEVQARPDKPVEGLRPGMSVLIEN